MADMKQHDMQIVIEKLNSVLSALRNQNSGADVHCVGNMRNTASLLILQLESDPDGMTDEEVRTMVKNIERKLVEFYRDKYPFSQ